MKSQRTSFYAWRTLWHEIGAAGDPLPWHQRLTAAYTQKSRHYHTQEHLNECLEEFEAVRIHVANSSTVELALWFHDAVYDPRSATNEEESANLARSCLAEGQVAESTIETVAGLVLCTKTHRPGEFRDAGWLIDCDLAILGQPAPRFWSYETAIRAEYAWVPEATYKQKRSEILAGFLRRPSLYYTAHFREKYERIARNNIEAAIARLQENGCS